MEPQYVAQTDQTASDQAMQSLLARNQAIQNSVYDMQAQNQQAAQVKGQSMPTSNTDLPSAAPVSIPAGAAPPAAGAGADAGYQQNVGRPTLANPQTPTFPGPGAPGPAPDYAAQVAAEQARYDSLAHPNGGSGNFTPDTAAINASAQRLADLKNQQAAQANPANVGPTGIPVFPASAPGATQGAFAGNTATDQALRAQQDLASVQSELARLKGNDPATQGQRQILQQELQHAQQAVAQAGQPQAPQGGQTAPAQAQQPTGPTGPGQTYSPGAGGNYNFDAQQAALQMQQLQHVFQMAQWKAQNAPTADQRAQAAQIMQEVQHAGQQLNGQIFSDKVYRATQDVAAGNMQSFGSLVQLASQMRGVPLAIHPAGNGQYVLLDPQGKSFGNAGTPADIAHFIYGQTPGGQQMLRSNAAAYNAAYQPAAGKAAGEAPAAQQLEYLKGEEAVRKALTEGGTQLAREAAIQHGITPTVNSVSGDLTLTRQDGSLIAVIPSGASSSTQPGLQYKQFTAPGVGGFK